MIRHFEQGLTPFANLFTLDRRADQLEGLTKTDLVEKTCIALAIDGTIDTVFDVASATLCAMPGIVNLLPSTFVQRRN